MAKPSSALLIDSGQAHWIGDGELAAQIAPLLPGVDIRCADDPGDPADIAVLAVSRTRPGQFAAYPNLALVQKLGAGVETIVADPSLAPSVKVARMRQDDSAREITEYCLAHVFAHLRDVFHHHRNQQRRQWSPREPRGCRDVRIAVLGLGHIGARVATTFAALGFAVDGVSRTPREIPGVHCRHGDEALDAVLATADYVLCILPSTERTRGLFDARRLAKMKPGSVLLNVGRGNLVVEDDLLAALDRGRPGGAVLDVFRVEPLPADHPLWAHPGVIVTPHVAGWHLGEGVGVVAENYRRLVEGRPLLHEVDRQLGY